MITVSLATQKVIDWIESCKDESQLNSVDLYITKYFIPIFKPSCIILSIMSNVIIDKIKQFDKLTKHDTK